jgi:hypothetical protein
MAVKYHDMVYTRSQDILYAAVRGELGFSFKEGFALGLQGRSLL